MKRLSSVRPRAHVVLLAVFTVTSMSATATAVADEGVIAGFFRGSEMKTTSIGEACFDDPDATFVYDVIDGVTASVAGTYDFSNTGHHYSGGSLIGVYTLFDPANPTANRVGWADVDTLFNNGSAQLETGVTYTIVVQSFTCGGPAPERGEWSFTYRGAGALSGPGIHPLPAYGAGRIDSSSPTFTSPACGLARYQSAGPINVPVTGEYVYSDASVHYDLDIEVYVYAGSFNANSPDTNWVTLVDDGATIALEAGTDYYFVTAPWGCGTTALGTYQYVLLGPSGEFVITEGVNGAWANFDTLGQGQLMEVYPDINLFFSAWFTWDTTQPGDGATAVVGDPNHRWLTAQGGYEGSTASLDIYLATGGLFDDPTPVENNAVGTMTIEFVNCGEAQVTYEMGDRAGSYTMNRIAPDNISTCEMLTNQHKVPVL